MRAMFYSSLLALCLSSFTTPASAQGATDAKAYIKQGIALYDRGQFGPAVEAYQQALKLEPANATAQYELAMTYNSMGRNAEAADLCRKLLKQTPEPDAQLYGTYGNALDGLRKPKDAVKIYQEGIKRYPDEGSLYYNLGVTQAISLSQTPEAIASMQQAVRCRPNHTNSHAALAMLTENQGNRIASVLETARLLQLEPQGKRAQEQLTRLDRMMGQGVQKTGANSVTINMSSDMMKEVGRNSSKPDNFATADMLLTMSSALDFDDKNKDKTPTERFIEKFGSLCRSLGEQKSNEKEGFVWQYYVPYFSELEKQGHLPALAYTIQASRAGEVPEVKAWLDQHPTDVQALQSWSAAYIWPK